jgi:hypothetical protein
MVDTSGWVKNIQLMQQQSIKLPRLPMHGKEPKKALKTKDAAQNDVYGKYNMH